MMSQVFGFFRLPLILMMAMVVLVGLYPEIGSCQTGKNDTEEDVLLGDGQGIALLDQDLDINFLEDEIGIFNKNVSSQDVQNIVASSNGPLGLWSGLKTDIVFGEDGSLLKSRRAGIFTYGTELLEIEETSWLTADDSLGNFYADMFYYSDTFDLSNTLTNSTYPFVYFREDLTKLAYDSEIEDLAFNTSSNSYLLMYDELNDKYKMAITNNLLDDSVADPLDGEFVQASSLPDGLDVDLSQYFTSDIWSKFGNIFNNPEVMKLFNEFAKKQLENQNQDQNNDDNLDKIENMFENCDGGVCCKWGTTA